MTPLTFRPGDAVSCWIGTRICVGVVVAVDPDDREPYTVRDDEGDGTWEAREVFPIRATEADVRAAQVAYREAEAAAKAARKEARDALFGKLKARALAGERVSFLPLLFV